MFAPKNEKNKGEPVPSGTHTVYIVRPFFQSRFFKSQYKQK